MAEIIKNKIVIVIGTDDLERQHRAMVLAQSYDHYTGAIDDGTQYREANEENKDIITEMKKLGCKTVTWKDHTPMMSSTSQDKTFDLTVE